jgi:hypothetical protein
MMRDVLVWIVCIPVRLAIALMTLWILLRDPAPPSWVRLSVAAYAAWTAIGFWTQAIVVRPTVGGFGGVVWWTEARWIHALLWTTAAIFLATSSEWWGAVPLLVDVVVGIGNTTRHQLGKCRQ